MLKRWQLDEFIPGVACLDEAGQFDAVITDEKMDRNGYEFARNAGLPLYRVVPGLIAPYGVPCLNRRDDLSLQLIPIKSAPDLPGASQEVEVLLQEWRESGVSWVNDTPPFEGPLGERFELIILDERDVNRAGSPQRALTEMMPLLSGESEHGLVIYLPKRLDDRSLRQWIERHLCRYDTMVIGDDYHVSTLLKSAQSVLLYSSTLELDARMRGKTCHVLYSTLSESMRIEVEKQLLRGCFYRNPENRTPVSLLSLISWLRLQRERRFFFTGDIYALGFSRWKYPVLRTYFQGANVHRVTSKHNADIPIGSTVVVWGSKPIFEYPGAEALSSDGYRVVRLEDAFIRSVGLGAKLVRPLSWVIDSKGIYYDPRTPSTLETLLNSGGFSSSDAERAALLMQRLIKENVTKYNVGVSVWQRPDAHRRVILVPGQVESDASILYGAGEIRTNIDLLKAVRSENPEAHILYKPHPDVLANLREQGVGEGDALEHCDEVITDALMAQLLDDVDEVHVMTSLAGFEGLIRRKTVVVYGSPFYAGWGLTRDKQSHPRRRRTLSLEQLVAGTLIYYPTYVSLKTGYYMTAEDALDQLIDWRENGTYDPGRLKLLVVWLRRRVLNLLGR
ncbi:hypothetical protein [Halomonas smyrnensis]|uniref:capsular polysaccharide export protein, LipB/KpsS family n=1 Tax=Halomonas smyrnensis TaxID=720605 RepID=UPI00192B9BD2|nr:hypothetical protein [Halomonas smyrnensis]